MADAKALFRRHWKEFDHELMSISESYSTVQAVIYAACIIAEAIRNEPDIEAKYIPGLHEQKLPQGKVEGQVTS